MGERLLSVGLDVGTTSTQMVVSRLTVENQASAFSVPDMEIRQRELLYQSPVFFTPLLEGNRMDAAALRRLVEQEYEKAGITRQMVDTGAVIVTGESSRTENAAAVMEALSHQLRYSSPRSAPAKPCSTWTSAAEPATLP